MLLYPLQTRVIKGSKVVVNGYKLLVREEVQAVPVESDAPRFGTPNVLGWYVVRQR
jgi:hypothetical protein